MPEQAVILLVDDSDDDLTLMRRAFDRAKLINPIVIVRNGEEALDYLSGTGRFANRAEYPLPALILLDIKMPGIDGLEVLRWIRSQPGLKALRVIMLTTSTDMRDVNTAYQLGANSFLTKPVDFENFVEVTRTLTGYWLWMDKAPEVSRPPPASSSETLKGRLLSLL
jgi:CheY-like chemotaxis protein